MELLGIGIGIMNRSTCLRSLLLSGLIVFVLAACSDSDEVIQLQGENEVVVRINGRNLTRKQMQSELMNLVLSVGSGMPLDELKQRAHEFELQAIQNLINTHLLVEEALKRGITVSQAEIDEQILQLKSAYQTAEEFSQELEMRELTDEELLEEARKGLLVEKVINQQLETVQIPTEAEVADFYDRNQEHLRRPEQFLISHILVQVLPDDTENVRAAKRLEIEDLRRRAMEGEDFGKLAYEHSNCPSSQRNGDLGWMIREQMLPEFESAIATLQPGDISGIIETSVGFHILRLQDRHAEELPALETIREDLSRYIQDLRKQSVIQSFVEKLRSEAAIDIIAVP